MVCCYLVTTSCSHYPINDARSVWQGEYTAFGTGGLYFAEFTFDDERTVHPKGWRFVSTFWVVEIDKDNRIRLRAVDLLSQKYLCEYVLNSPFERKYTPEQRKLKSNAPRFADNATVKLIGNKVIFDAAESTDGMPVFIYRVFAVDTKGERRQIARQLSGYFRAEPEKKIRIKIDKSLISEEYCEVVAENCYGLQSKPLFFRYFN